jgi:hypothetical protein
MRLLAFLSLAVLLLAACGGISAESNGVPIPDPGSSLRVSPEPDPDLPDAPAASGASGTTVAPMPTSTTRSPGPRTPADVDLVSYIEVIEHLLVGTSYEGMAFEAPHVFLATGALFCDQLDAGASSNEVLLDYIEELTGSPVEEASDDALTMAGAVLGSGLATMCPHHIGKIGITE